MIIKLKVKVMAVIDKNIRSSEGCHSGTSTFIFLLGCDIRDADIIRDVPTIPSAPL